MFFVRTRRCHKRGEVCTHEAGARLPAEVVRYSRILAFLLVAGQVTVSSAAGLPKRLVLAVDGVAYRDMKALQEGLTYTDLKGRTFHRQAFHRGYFPVSLNVSSFPSASDVAWTEIFGDRPLPGYQRTYFSAAANTQIALNGVTTSMEHERQMSWQVEDGFLRTLGYVFPRRTFDYEVHELVKNFLAATNGADNYYAYIRTTDDAQHLSVDIFAILSVLDEKLEGLRGRYRASEGRELEIVILSDHGNNHAGPAKRVEIRSYLKEAGYRVRKSIHGPKDVVLPTVGIESWVEVHNAPAETEKLVQLLWRLPGVDILTAQDAGAPNRFVVMNAKGERAAIDWDPARNAFRYSPVTGDPLAYSGVVAALSRKNLLDAEGFAQAEDWMGETLWHHYPLAVERIVRGHTRAALNPATILISLKNDYVHAGWLVKKGSDMVRFGGTHGGLDDLNSNGMLVSTFARTHDTSGSRVAEQFGGFPGLRDYRAAESGAEWVCERAQALTAIARMPLDRDCRMLASDRVYLRVWTPRFAALPLETPVEVTVEKARRFRPARVRRGDPEPAEPREQRWTLKQPLTLPDACAYERVYALPSEWVLDPQERYRISVRIADPNENSRIVEFAFHTDQRGQPAAY
jgi:hypothetical protein